MRLMRPPLQGLMLIDEKRGFFYVMGNILFPPVLAQQSTDTNTHNAGMRVQVQKGHPRE